MIISTVNVNGIRAAVKQRSETNLGFLDWLHKSEADVVLLQEVRASEAETEKALAPALEDGWHYRGAPSVAKGRAGVGILSRQPLDEVRIGIPGFEDAGRYIEGIVAVEGTEVTVASLYLPSGAAGTAKQDEKYRFLDAFEVYLQEKGDIEGLHMVIGGDWNICHRDQDLKNFASNRNKSGFLPQEREFMDAVFGCFPDEQPQVKTGKKPAADWEGAVEYRSQRRRQANADPKWFDVARRLEPVETKYTWWTYRGQAFDNDAGWRIDYQAVTEPMLVRARRAVVDKAAAYDLRWSDHSPLTVEYQ